MTVTVGSGQVLSGTTIYSDTLIVSSGGTAISITLSGYYTAGTEILFGVDSGAIIVAGGSQTISSGGIASNVVVSGGSQTLFSGGVASNTRVIAGTETISAGGLAFNTNIGGGARANVQAGGVASGLTIASAGYAYVSGQVLGTVLDNGTLYYLAGSLLPATLSGSGTIVAGSGTLLLQSTNTFSGAYLVSSGGALELASGVSLGNATLSMGSGATVRFDGAPLTSTIISGFAVTDRIDLASVVFSSGATARTIGGGLVAISEGGTVYDVQLNPLQNFSGAIVRVSPDIGGGTLVSLESAATSTVLSGQTTSGTTISASVQDVFGTAVSTNLTSGSEQNVYAGGSVSATSVGSQSDVIVWSGAVASGDYISFGGREIVLGGGVASATFLLGSQYVSSGAKAVGAIVGSSANAYTASQVVLSGAVASGTIIVSGAMTVSSGALTSGAVLSLGGAVQDYGSAIGTILSGGVFYVNSGGYASGTIVRNGTESIAGIAVSTIMSNGTESLVSGGVLSGVTIVSGVQNVAAGAIAYDTVMNSGSIQDYGIESRATISGGTLNIWSGAVAQALTVGSSGSVVLNSGAIVSNVFDNGTIAGYVGGTIAGLSGSGLVRATNGALLVQSADAFSGTYSLSYATLELAGGLVSGPNTILFGGSSGILKIDGAVTTGVTISGIGTTDVIDLASIPFNAAGTVQIQSGNLLDVTENNSSYFIQLDQAQNLSGLNFRLLGDGSGGSDILVLSGAVVSSGQSVSGTSVSNGSDQDVFGTAVSTIVSGGGLQTVESGGIASAAIVSSAGAQIVFSGGLASGGSILTNASQTLSGGVASSTTVSGGTEIISAGGIASAVNVSGGTQTISSGGSAGGTFFNGGTQTILSGATASGTTGSSLTETISSGGLTLATNVSNATVMVYGSASGTTLTGGQQYISSGGVAIGTNLTYTYQFIYSGGMAINTTLTGYFESVNAGAITSNAAAISGGTISLNGNGYLVSALAGGIISVGSGGVATSTSVASGGTLLEASGGAVSGLAIANGGSAVISSGAVVTGSVVDNGVLAFGGASLVGTSISGSGTILVSSGYLASGSAGVLVLQSLSAFSGALVLQSVNSSNNPASAVVGAMLELASGANPAGATVVFSGTSDLLRIDGSAIPNIVISGSLNGNAIDLVNVAYSSAATVQVRSGTTLEITEGGSAYDLNVASGLLSGLAFIVANDGSGGTLLRLESAQIVASGQTVSGATLSSGLTQEVYGSAQATTVKSGGVQIVEMGGVASGAIVSSGGSQSLAGGIASATSIISGAEIVGSGGVAANTILSGGSQTILSGGSASGTTGSALTAIVSFGGARACDEPVWWRHANRLRLSERNDHFRWRTAIRAVGRCRDFDELVRGHAIPVQRWCRDLDIRRQQQRRSHHGWRREPDCRQQRLRGSSLGRQRRRRQRRQLWRVHICFEWRFRVVCRSLHWRHTDRLWLRDECFGGRLRHSEYECRRHHECVRRFGLLRPGRRHGLQHRDRIERAGRSVWRHREWCHARRQCDAVPQQRSHRHRRLRR